MENEMINNNQTPDIVYEPPKAMTRKTKRLIFYIAMVALPFAQFLLFYVYVHANSIAMAFRVEKALPTGGVEVYYSLSENFKMVWSFLQSAKGGIGITNSLKNYFIGFFTSGIFSIFFSYYVYKKFFGASTFKVFLYLPSIISGLVLINVYKELMDRVIPEFINDTFYDGETVVFSILDQNKYTWVLAYSVFMGLGGHILMYTGAMSGINESVVESAQLDGVNAIQEFWYITLPLIYPTFVTFTITGIAGIFTAHPNLHTFYGLEQPISENIHTIGFYIFASVKEGSIISSKSPTEQQLMEDYWRYERLSLTQVSALGLMITAVMLPTTLIIKKLMTKYGPSTD